MNDLNEKILHLLGIDKEVKNKHLTEPNPFSWEPETTEHSAIGVCIHCGETAYTLDAHDRLSCWPCAYSDAS